MGLYLLVGELFGCVEYRDAEHIGYMFYGFGISLVVKFHYEAYGISMCATTETVVGVSCRIYYKRGCPLVMERTAAKQICTSASECYVILVNNVHDVGSVVDLLNR